MEQEAKYMALEQNTGTTPDERLSARLLSTQAYMMANRGPDIVILRRLQLAPFLPFISSWFQDVYFFPSEDEMYDYHPLCQFALLPLPQILSSLSLFFFSMPNTWER